MIEGLLKEAKIPVYLNPISLSYLPGPTYHNDPKEYELVVPDNRAAEATQIVADYLASLKEDPPSEDVPCTNNISTKRDCAVRDGHRRAFRSL